MDRVGAQTELSVKSKVSSKAMINDLLRQHIFSFRYDASKIYYVLFVTESSSSLVCDWPGQFHACFMMRANSSKDSFHLLCKRLPIEP